MNVSNETRNCPFCLHPVEPGEEKIRCPKCGVTHHADCWKANGQCSVYGCDGWAAWNESISERIAPSVQDGMIVDEHPKPKTPQVTRCIRCGVEVGPKQVMCQSCNWKSKKYWGENCFGPAVLIVCAGAGSIALILRAILL